MNLYRKINFPKMIKAVLIAAMLLLLRSSFALAQMTVLEPPLTQTTGEQRLLILLANFENLPPQPDVTATVNGMIDSVKKYYAEVSFQKTSINAEVKGWYTIPVSSDGLCSADAIFSEAVKAVDPEVFFPNYKRVAVIFPYVACFSAGGAGTLGDIPVITQDGTVMLSKIWLNGYSYGALAHELGHNLGLDHANGWDCFVPESCFSIEYADPYDAMGINSWGHFNAGHKDRLNWFGPASIKEIKTKADSGVYTVGALEFSSPSLKTLKILREPGMPGQRSWYYVETRQSYGMDVGLNRLAFSGVLIHIVYEGQLRKTSLIDITPESRFGGRVGEADFIDSPLLVGQAFIDPSGISIKVISAGEQRTPSGILEKTFTVEVSTPFEDEDNVKRITNNALLESAPSVSENKMVWMVKPAAIVIYICMTLRPGSRAGC